MYDKAVPRNIYLDDTNFTFSWNNLNKEIYIISGFVILAQKEKEFEADINEIKARYGISALHPLKWNLKGLKEFYKSRNEMNKLDSLIKNSDALRDDIFDVLKKDQYEAVLYASAVARIIDQQKPKAFYQRCFVNLLQRVAQNLKIADKAHGLFIDFIKEDSDCVADCYASCFHKGIDLEGNKFIVGPLDRKGLSSCLYFGKTNHNHLLQVADMVTGCARTFYEYCFMDQGFDRLMRSFPKIMCKFCWNEKDETPLRRGVVIAPKALYPNLEKGFSKVANALVQF